MLCAQAPDLHKLTACVVLGYAAASCGVVLEEEQALSIRQAFFRTYSRLRQWHGLSHRQAEEGVTEVRTRTGRRRLISSK